MAPTDDSITLPDPAPELADDSSANDAYENPGAATGAAPVPPRILPSELEEVQSAVQGGDSGEGGAAQPAPGGGERDGGTFNVNEANGEALNAELERRNADRPDDEKISVTGTGQGGNVLVEDVRSALKADDERQAAAS